MDYQELSDCCSVRYRESTYRSIFTDDEVSTIVGEYGGRRFNGATVRIGSARLDANGKVERLELEASHYYDLLATNLAIHANTDAWSPESQRLVDHLRDKLDLKALEDDPLGILSYEFLANDLAVSLLLQDGNGNFLLTQRSSAVALSADFYGVSVTGAIDPADLGDMRPIACCCAREAREELGLEISPEEISVRGLFVGPRKLQPIAICDARVKSLEDVAGNYEILQTTLVPRTRLAPVLEQQMTEAARFHIGLHL